MNKLRLALINGIGFTLVLLGIGLTVSADYVLSSGLYDDNVPVVALTGSWSDYVDSLQYGGSARISSGLSDTYSFTFYGDDVTLFITRTNTGGDSLVCIDSNCSNLSFYAASIEYQVAINYSGLDIDNHDIEVIVQSGDVLIDAIYIEPVPSEISIIVEITEETTQEPYLETWEILSAGESHTVAFEYKADVGQMLNIYLIFAVLIVLLIQLTLNIWWNWNTNDID